MGFAKMEVIYGEFNCTIDLTLRDIERSHSRSLRFESLISRKGTRLGHILLLNIIFNRKEYMESQIDLK